MNAAYARTYVDFWTGPTGIKLAQTGEDGARTLALFLISGPNCESWGLYRKPLEVIIHELKRPTTGEFLKAEKDIRRWFDILADVGFAELDEENGFVWVHEMAAYQFRPLPLKATNLLVKSARRWYGTLGRNRFLGPYFDRYDIELHLSDPFAFPGTQVERRDWSPASTLFDVAPAAPVESTALAVRVKHATADDFETWWQHYPAHRRKAKKACLAVWLRKKIPAVKLPAMIALLEAQKEANDWRKNQGQYVPLPLTYLNQERYDDESVGMSHGGLNPTNEVTANTLAELMNEIDDADLEPR